LESDHTVRKAIALTMIDAIVAEVLTQEPSEEELRTFYGLQRAVFSTPDRLHIQHIFCGGGVDLVKARTRAEQAREALAQGLSFPEARERYGDEDAITLPDELTPLVVIRRALGPTLSEAALALQVGEVALVPVEAVGYYVFRLVSRQYEQVQPYKMVKQEVRAEYFRRKRDEALQQYLDRWRRDAVIVLSPKVQRLDMIANTERTTGP
jgi:parvulin-like peptidyl-prolyl isomerase